MGGPGTGAGDGDEVCGSDLEEKDQHSEILNTVHTQMLSSIYEGRVTVGNSTDEVKVFEWFCLDKE